MCDYINEELQCNDRSTLEDDLSYNEHLCYDEEDYEIAALSFRQNFYSKDEQWRYRYNVTFPLENVCISDLCLVFKSRNIDPNLYTLFAKTQIILEIGGNNIYIIPLFINSIIATLIDKSVKQDDDLIKIPLIFFDISKRNRISGTKFPLYAIRNRQVTISLISLPESISLYTQLEYRKYKLKQNDINHNKKITNINDDIFSYDYIIKDEYLTDGSYDLTMINPIRRFTKSANLNTYNTYVFTNGDGEFHPTKLLIFYNSNDNIDMNMNMNLLEQVQLSHNNDKSYTWNYNDGDIMKIKIFNKIVYIISLDSEYRSIKRMKNMCKKYIESNRNNGFVFNQTSRITLKFANDSAKILMKIYEIRYNIGKIMDGIFRKM